MDEHSMGVRATLRTIPEFPIRESAECPATPRKAETPDRGVP